MKNERLHTDEKLKSITLEQIAIDAEKWPRKQVEQFFERQGLDNECYRAPIGRSIVRTYQTTTWQHQFSNFDSVPVRHIKLTLPDALRWEELQKDNNPFSLISDFARKASEACQTVSEAKELRDENAQLRARIAELESEKESAEEDRRVDFGDQVTFDTFSGSETSFIGKDLVSESDRNKVLISGEGYKWVLEEDYFEGRNAVSLIKTK